MKFIIGASAVILMVAGVVGIIEYLKVNQPVPQEVTKVEYSKRVVECWKTVHLLKLSEGGTVPVTSEFVMHASFKGLDGKMLVLNVDDFNLYMKLREGTWYEVEYTGEPAKIMGITETERPYAEFKPEDY